MGIYVIQEEEGRQDQGRQDQGRQEGGKEATEREVLLLASLHGRQDAGW